MKMGREGIAFTAHDLLWSPNLPASSTPCPNQQLASGDGPTLEPAPPNPKRMMHSPPDCPVSTGIPRATQGYQGFR